MIHEGARRATNKEASSGSAIRPLAWALLGIALASAALYALGITARYPLALGLRSPRAGWSTLAGNSLAVGAALAGTYGLLIAGYALALRLVLRSAGRPTRRTIAIIVIGWLASSAALLGAYPGESLDIFDYVFRGRMIAEYGASPLAIAPSAFYDRPFYEYITWRGQVDTYGPLWEYASGAVAWLVHHAFGRADSHAAYILGYRLLAVLLAGLCGLVIALIAWRADPALAPAALLAWLWNPLLLITTAMGAHNDILMMLAVSLALLLFQRRRWVWGLLAIGLAAHVKLTALLVLPVLGVWLLRRRGWLGALRDGALALALALPLSWLLYAPFGGWATLGRMLQERARLLVNSPADLVYRLLQQRFGWAEPAAWRATTQAATLAFFAIAAVVLAWLWWSDYGSGMRKAAVFSPPGHQDTKSIRPLWLGVLVAKPAAGQSQAGLAESNAELGHHVLLWRAALAVTMAYLLVGSFWFQHWYLLWALAPAALLPASRWTLTLLPTYCLGALWSNLTNSFLRNLAAYPLSATQVSAINILAQVAPLLCVLLAAQLWRAVPRLQRGSQRLRAAAPAQASLAPAAHDLEQGQ